VEGKRKREGGKRKGKAMNRRRRKVTLGKRVISGIKT